MSEVKLIEASNPVAKDAIAARDRQTSLMPVRFQGRRLGNLPVEETYIYPRVGGQKSPGEILRTLVDMADRPAGTRASPSIITLLDGTTVNAVITGFHLNLPGG